MTRVVRSECITVALVIPAPETTFSVPPFVPHEYEQCSSVPKRMAKLMKRAGNPVESVNATIM